MYSRKFGLDEMVKVLKQSKIIKRTRDPHHIAVANHKIDYVIKNYFDQFLMKNYQEFEIDISDCHMDVNLTIDGKNMQIKFLSWTFLDKTTKFSKRLDGKYFNIVFIGHRRLVDKFYNDFVANAMEFMKNQKKKSCLT
jgi:hypothetical protein